MGGESARLPVIFSETLTSDDCVAQVGYTKDRRKTSITFPDFCGEIIPRIEDPIPAVTRDPKDDYLLAYAVVGQADYLITGDHDLLVLQKVIGVTICNSRDYVDR